eukprot:TRINITY_DN4485_c0_g2_i1.p1 TRINITY_DN4485_c0_g2~~TRINITY_DN4485_c0_g2_i1.p1  ORF type:complete len:576 (-),score=131.12 TRINITY_DN4485_c0_g2_i1:47-1774(-)
MRKKWKKNNNVEIRRQVLSPDEQCAIDADEVLKSDLTPLGIHAFEKIYYQLPDNHFKDVRKLQNEESQIEIIWHGLKRKKNYYFSSFCSFNFHADLAQSIERNAEGKYKPARFNVCVPLKFRKIDKREYRNKKSGYYDETDHKLVYDHIRASQDVPMGKLWLTVRVEPQEDSNIFDEKEREEFTDMKSLLSRDFGEEVISYLLKSYMPFSDVPSEIKDNFRYLIDAGEKLSDLSTEEEKSIEFKKISVIESLFESILLFLCVHDKDPVRDCVEAYAQCENFKNYQMCYKTTPTDQRLVLNRWSEVKSRVSDIAVSFLNLYDDVPAKYTEGLQDTIKEIPELAHECDMLNVVAHDVVHEACYDEWISGDNILQMLSKCGGSGTITISPVCGFLSQFLCYMLFLIVLTLPIFIRSANRDDIFWMGEYINGQLLGPFEEGGEGIANGEAFYQYLEFLTAELFNPANRNSTKLKLYDDIVLRQYAVKVEKCRDDSPYNCTKDLSIFDQDRNNDSPKKLGEFTSDGRSVYYTKMNGLLFDGDLRYTISKDNTNTSASIQDLRNDNWISDGTRVVIAEIGV